MSDSADNVHLGVWDNSLDPARTVESSAVVEFECRGAPNGAFDRYSTAEDLETMSFDGHQLTGPIYVEVAQPGDVLEIEFLDFEHKGFGVSYFYPEEESKGLVPAEFDGPGLHVWEPDDCVGTFVDGIEVPLDPFPGIAGVAPAEDGKHSTTPSRRVGGNLDIKHLTADSTLYLPVEVAGALFSIGDCHAAQGDGEVCVTGIEAPIFVTARLSVRSDPEIDQPQGRSPRPVPTKRCTGRPALRTTSWKRQNWLSST